MRVREVHVAVGMTVNAGNYNSERLEVGLTAELDPEELEGDMINVLIDRARQRIRFHFSNSDNPNVRRYVQPPAVEGEDTPF